MLLREDAVESAVHEFVLRRVALGVYDPAQPRRARVPVISFEIEFLELDGAVVHAAGPVRLQSPAGEMEKFLRISVEIDAAGCIVETGPVRAVYVEETDSGSGACKETAALANC